MPLILADKGDLHELKASLVYIVRPRTISRSKHTQTHTRATTISVSLIKKQTTIPIIL